MGKVGGGVCKAVDGVLLVYLVVIAVVPPLLELPDQFLPSFSVELKRWYTETFDDYLFSEKPHFFVGLACVEVFIQSPLALASAYAIGSTSLFSSTVFPISLAR